MMSLNPQSPCPNGQRIEDPQSYFLSYLEGPVPSLQRMLSATASESAPITGNPNDKYLDKFPQVGYIQNGLQIGTDSVRSEHTFLHANVSDAQFSWDPMASTRHAEPRATPCLQELTFMQRNRRKIRRRLNAKEKQEFNLARKFGACDKCRKGKRKVCKKRTNKR